MYRAARRRTTPKPDRRWRSPVLFTYTPRDMAHFDTLPEHAPMPALMMRFPSKGALLNQLGDALLRGPSELSPAQRELLFAYVSGLNSCDYCHHTHTHVAERQVGS